jgi:large subunit ribosomal protein L22
MKAKAKYVRIAPRKARLVADEVRGKSYPEAVSLLQFTNKRAAKIIAEVVESAAANAEHNDDEDPEELFVRDIRVDDGPTIKRYRARAMGRRRGGIDGPESTSRRLPSRRAAQGREGRF